MQQKTQNLAAVKICSRRRQAGNKRENGRQIVAAVQSREFPEIYTSREQASPESAKSQDPYAAGRQWQVTPGR